MSKPPDPDLWCIAGRASGDEIQGCEVRRRREERVEKGG